MLIRSFRRRRQPIAPQPSGPTDLERHVARCRRSGAPAALLVARLSDGAALPADIHERLRVSDSWMRTGPSELALLCDADALDRALVERRLGAVIGGRLLCGWATFPDDGLVVEDLAAIARRRAVAAQAPAAAPSKLLVAER